MDKVVSRTFTVTAIHDGTDGYNTYVVRLYKRKMGSLPAPGDNERPQIPLWYKFSTQKLYTDAGCTTEFTTSTTGGNGWGMDIPAAEDGKKIYITCATAYAQGDIDKIEVSQSPAVNEWSTPVVYTENGSTAATVAIYKRAASQPSDKPTDGAVYTFADNSLVAASGGSLNGWSTAFPDSNGQPCWRRQATALSNTGTDTINASEWSDPAVKVVEDGESPFVADINNENDGIICDDTGYVLAKADGTNQSVSTVVSLYHGNALAGFDTPTVKRNRTPMTLGTASNGVTISWNATTRTLTVSYAASAKINGKDDIEITIQATSDHSVTRTLHFTVIASTGDVYNLLPADSEIVAQRNNDGTYTVNGSQTYTIRCKYTKRDINGNQTEGDIDANGVVDGKYYVFLCIRRRSDQKWKRWNGSTATYDETDSEGNPYPLMWNRFTGDASTVDINTYDAVQLMLSVGGSDHTGGYAPASPNAIDYETISVVANGYTPQKNVDYFDGKNSVRIDLDNETDMVAVDSDGNVIFDRTITVHAKIYNGANVQTTGVTKAPSLTVANMKIGTSSTVTVSSVSDGVVTITWTLKKGDSVASTTRTIALKYDDVEYSAVFSLLAKETQAIYQLLPSCDSIKFTRQSDGTLTPSTVYPYCGYVKYTGSGVEPHPLQYEVTHSEIRNFDNSGYTIWFRFLNADGSVFVWDAETSPYGWIWMDSTSSRVIGSGTTYSAIQYCIAPVEDDRTKWSDSDIIDLETIPIVKDGAKGNNGESPWVADINNENDGIICDETGYVLAKADGTNQSVSTVVSLYHGNALAGFGTPTVKRNGTPMTLGSASNGVTISWNATTRTLTVAYATTAKISGKDDIEITITATGESITRTLHFTVMAQTGDVYNLLPDVSEIVADNDNGTYKVNGSTSYTIGCKYTKRDINGNKEPRDIDANGVVDGKYYVFRTVRRRSDQKWQRWNGTTTTFDETDAQGNPYPLMWSRFKGEDKTVNINTYDAVQLMLSVDGSEHTGGYAPLVINAIDYETISVIANGAKGNPGPKGEDAYSIDVNPEYAIFEETRDGNDNRVVIVSGYQASIQIFKSGTAQSFKITSRSVSTVDGHATCTISADSTALNTETTNAVFKFGRINTYTTGSGQSQQTLYYKEGYVEMNIQTADGKFSKSGIRVPFYVNRIATWEQTVEDGTRSIVAEATSFETLNGVLTVNGKTYTQTANAAQTSDQWISTVNTSASTVANYNTRISNAEENISTVTKKVNNGKNLLSGVLTGTGWKSGSSVSALTTNAKVDNDQWIVVGTSGQTMLKTPPFTVEGGIYYKISFETESMSAVAIRFYNALDNTLVATWSTDSGSVRHTAGFSNSNDDLSVYMVVVASKLRYPQIEEGNEATDFEADSTETSSMIKQTADEINLSVQTNYATKSELQVTADEITSTVKQLQKGKNMLSGALLGTGWMSASSGITPHARTKDVVDNWIACNDDDTYVVSPNLSIKKDTTYTLAFDVPTDVPTPITAVTVKIYSTTFQLLHTLTTNTNGRRKVSFTAEANNGVMVYFQTQKIHYPQLELGTIATDFEANTGETVSQITQTASEINLSIRDGLESTGINITTGKVAVEADNFTVGKNGTQVFGVDANTGVTTMKDVDIKGSLMYHKTIIDNNNNYIKNYQFYDVNGAPVNDSYSGTIASCKIPYDTIVIGGTKRMSSYTDPIENVVVDEGFRVILPPAKFFVGMRIRIINCTIASGHQAASLSPSRLDIGVVYREDLDEIYTDGDGGTYAFNFVAAASPLSVDLRNTSTSTRSTFVGAPDTSVVNRPNLGSADKRNYAYLVGDKTATPVRYREIELVSQQNPYTSGGYAWIIIDTQQ